MYHMHHSQQIMTASACASCLSTFVCSRLCAGKPLSLHGSYGREYATGRGVLLAARELLKAEHAGRIVDKEFVIQVPTPSTTASQAHVPVLACTQQMQLVDATNCFWDIVHPPHATGPPFLSHLNISNSSRHSFCTNW